MEEELIQIVNDVKYTNGTPSYQPLYNFFSKVLQKNETIKITDQVRETIPFLSSCDEGLLWPIAEKAFPGVQPSMLVPTLVINTNTSLTQPTSVRRTLSAHPTSLPTALQLPIPTLTKKTIRPIKVMTTRDILPSLATSIPGQFYYCTPRSKDITAPHEQTGPVTYKVHRKKLPPIPVSPDQRIFTLNGMLHISQNNKSEFTSMKKYLKSNSNLFLSKNLPLFKNWNLNKIFTKWRNQLQKKRYHRLESTVLNSCPFGHTEFIEMYFKVREFAYEVLTQCHPITSEKGPTENFPDLIQNSKESLEEMQSKMDHLNSLLKEKLSHFIFQVNGISEILRTDFSLLKQVNALPQSVIPYSLDNEDKRPSITGTQIRTKQLNRERRRAYDRKEYLNKFFVMIRFFLRDFYVEQIHIILREFYTRFTETPSTRAHMVQLVLDHGNGLILSPSRAEFLDWFNQVDETIKNIFKCDQLTLDQEVMDQLFPHNDCPDVEIIQSVAINDEMVEMKTAALNLINEAYDHFEKKLKPSALLMSKLQNRIEEIEQMEEFSNVDEYAEIVKETLDSMSSVEQMQRITTFGSLYSDMKVGKSAGIEKIRAVIEKVRKVGIAKANALFEEIDLNRHEFNKQVSYNKTMRIETESPEMQANKQLIKTQCNTYLQLADCIIISSSIGVPELETQMITVKEILLLVNPPKPPRWKRVKKVKKTKKTETDAE